MKISVAISILILAITAGVGWRGQQRLAFVREQHAKLIVRATQSGISLDPANPNNPIRITKRERKASAVDAKLLAAEFIAFAKEMEALERSGESQTDPAVKKRMMDFMDRMMSLDAAQLKALIAEVRASKDLKDDTRNGLIGFSIMSLASEHPQAALALFTESSDLFKEGGMREHIVSSSLAKWAKDDPLGALDWVKQNGKKFPDLITDDTKLGLISGAASQDPKLAFQILSELGLKDADNGIESIIRTAKTSEQRTTTLIALRDYLAKMPDEKSRKDLAENMMPRFGNSAAEEGFEAGSKWLANAKLTPSELEFITSSMSYNVKDGENGKWIEWLGTNLAPEKSEQSVRRMVERWTEKDYAAAGKWLTTTSDGPTKTAAVRSYAETIAQYEPETAAQWALTLPAGKDRDQTIKQIYQKWPASDAAGKEAFGIEHGIK
ncbi:MAG: hypothetical protein H8M99_16030 [Gloeobacteraceae cyanobacterium ES-bin-144]|nr:hypothetical protein [Verrucomicrobiales bacterium]